MAGEIARSYSPANGCQEITTSGGAESTVAVLAGGSGESFLPQWGLVAEGSGALELVFKDGTSPTITVGVGTVLGGGFTGFGAASDASIKVTLWY